MEVNDLVRSRPIRRVTGTIDIPLTVEGREEAERIAKLTAGAWTSITSSPMQRTLETARIIMRTNPQVQCLEVSPLAGPWPMGSLEGKPYGEVQRQINRLILQTPNIAPPGISPSGKEGVPFNEAVNAIIKALQYEMSCWEPKQRRAVVTHGREISIVDSWLRGSSPWNRQISRPLVLRSHNDSPASMFLVTSKGLKPILSANEFGIVLIRHAETPFAAAPSTS